MKAIRLVIAVAMAVFGLALPTSALSSIPALMPKPETTGNVTYLSGGIGESEAAMMKGVAKDYPLEVVFVQKLKQREEYLAAVKVQIQDRQQNVVLDIITNGPYLLADLPQGKYLIIAEYNNAVKQQWVRIDTKKHKKIVFWWPISDSP